MSDLDAWRNLGTAKRPARYCVACGAGTGTGVLWCMKCRAEIYYRRQLEERENGKD